MAKTSTAKTRTGSLPRESALDSTAALLAEGYLFVPRRCARHGSDVFAARLMLRRAYCASGDEAARMFYHPGRFTRNGAMPPTALAALQDRGSVQTLDGEAHRARKAMFLTLLASQALAQLLEAAAREWRRAASAWAAAGELVLFHAAEEVLCRAACAWAGVPLEGRDAVARSREFDAMIEGAGAVGPRNWRGLLLRRRTERWARKAIAAARSGAREAPAGSALQVLASHRDAEGRALSDSVAAVELLNLLRPAVAVARYVVFAAHALHHHPRLRESLASAGEEELECFVQEVRRFYPFFPLIGGRAREPFEWRGHRFAQGSWVLLDLYGTNHDARLWERPHEFDPQRFRRWPGGAFDFVPQGGGDVARGHRCPGERVTIELVKQAVRFLAVELVYEVPAQDLSIDLSRMPAIPQSRFVIRNARPAR